MAARAIITGAAFGPAARNVMTKAFDDAWLEIEDHFHGDARAGEHARIRLANAILHHATEDGRDAEALKNSALQTMALTSRSGCAN